MKSVDFPQANIALAKDQPQYQTLYVYCNRESPQVPMTMCFELSQEEVNEIVRTGKLYFTQITFGKPFSPINMSVLSPFEEMPEWVQPPADENRTTSDVWDKTHFKSKNVHPLMIHKGECLNCGKDEADHYWSTRQCKL